MIRRYQLTDIDEMLVHIKYHLTLTKHKNITFAEDKMRHLLTGNVNNSQFFANLIISDENKIVGGLCASIMAYSFSYEAIAYDHLFYIVKEYRSPTAAVDLVNSYLEWAKERKVREALLQNVSGVRTEAYSKFAERLGFRLVGTTYAKDM